MLRINTIYSGNLAWFSVNSSTHSFSSRSCDSIKFFQLGWGTRSEVDPTSCVHWPPLNIQRLPTSTSSQGRNPFYRPCWGSPKKAQISECDFHYCITNIAQTFYILLLLLMAARLYRLRHSNAGCSIWGLYLPRLKSSM